MTAEEFTKKIDIAFANECDDTPIYEFVDYLELDKGKTFLKENGLTIHEKLDEIRYDSYGSEDSILRTIFFHEETGRYFELHGRRCSYGGTDWNGIKEVRQVEEVVIKYI